MDHPEYPLADTKAILPHIRPKFLNIYALMPFGMRFWTYQRLIPLHQWYSLLDCCLCRVLFEDQKLSRSSVMFQRQSLPNLVLRY